MHYLLLISYHASFIIGNLPRIILLPSTTFNLIIVIMDDNS